MPTVLFVSLAAALAALTIKASLSPPRKQGEQPYWTGDHWEYIDWPSKKEGIR